MDYSQILRLLHTPSTKRVVMTDVLTPHSAEWEKEELWGVGLEREEPLEMSGIGNLVHNLWRHYDLSSVMRVFCARVAIDMVQEYLWQIPRVPNDLQNPKEEIAYRVLRQDLLRVPQALWSQIDAEVPAVLFQIDQWLNNPSFSGTGDFLLMSQRLRPIVEEMRDTDTGALNPYHDAQVAPLYFQMESGIAVINAIETCLRGIHLLILDSPYRSSTIADTVRDCLMSYRYQAVAMTGETYRSPTLGLASLAQSNINQEWLIRWWEECKARLAFYDVPGATLQGYRP